jgi:hypothetical protein
VHHEIALISTMTLQNIHRCKLQFVVNFQIIWLRVCPRNRLALESHFRSTIYLQSICAESHLA